MHFMQQKLGAGAFFLVSYLHELCFCFFLSEGFKCVADFFWCVFWSLPWSPSPCFFPLVCFTKDCECCADAFLGELYHSGTGTLRSNVIPDMRGINCKRCEITYPGAQVIPAFFQVLTEIHRFLYR